MCQKYQVLGYGGSWREIDGEMDHWREIKKKKGKRGQRQNEIK